MIVRVYQRHKQLIDWSIVLLFLAMFCIFANNDFLKLPDRALISLVIVVSGLVGDWKT